MSLEEEERGFTRDAGRKPHTHVNFVNDTSLYAEKHFLEDVASLNP